jgi:hypothetical protein
VRALGNGTPARAKREDLAEETVRRRGLLSRSVTSPYLFSGLVKCGQCGANLIVGTGEGERMRDGLRLPAHPKYVYANYLNRGTTAALESPC